MVFVLDKHKKPLMPWSPKRARLLLARRRAVVHHRGAVVHQAMLKRAGHRRGGANLRYREPRFDHRRRRQGWLPPSLISRVGNILSWARRYSRCAPVRRIEVERVKFDLQLLQNPEISGIEYQLPRSRGGSNRVSNLVLACHDCNLAKGNRTAAEFGHPQVEAQAKAPLKDAAAVNATRYALCLGDPVGVDAGKLKTVVITATGRGRYARTNVDECGFPRGYLMCQKQVRGKVQGHTSALLSRASAGRLV